MKKTILAVLIIGMFVSMAFVSTGANFSAKRPEEEVSVEPCGDEPWGFIGIISNMKCNFNLYGVSPVNATALIGFYLYEDETKKLCIYDEIIIDRFYILHTAAPRIFFWWHVSDIFDKKHIIIVEYGYKNPLAERIGDLYSQRVVKSGDTLLSFYQREKEF